LLVRLTPALGVFLSTPVVENIDACSIEGFNNEDVYSILSKVRKDKNE